MYFTGCAMRRGDARLIAFGKPPTLSCRPMDNPMRRQSCKHAMTRVAATCPGIVRHPLDVLHTTPSVCSRSRMFEPSRAASCQDSRTASRVAIVRAVGMSAKMPAPASCCCARRGEWQRCGPRLNNQPLSEQVFGERVRFVRNGPHRMCSTRYTRVATRFASR